MGQWMQKGCGELGTLAAGDTVIEKSGHQLGALRVCRGQANN